MSAARQSHLGKKNLMSHISRAREWKLNTATPWHDRGTIRMGIMVKSAPRGGGLLSPLCPWGYHGSPVPSASSMPKTAFPIRHNWLWRRLPICFQIQDEQCIHCLQRGLTCGFRRKVILLNNLDKPRLNYRITERTELEGTHMNYQNPTPGSE